MKLVFCGIGVDICFLNPKSVPYDSGNGGYRKDTSLVTNHARKDSNTIIIGGKILRVLVSSSCRTVHVGMAVRITNNHIFGAGLDLAHHDGV